MFGFSLAAQLLQGSAQRTWNCVTQFTNLLWYKFNHTRPPIMPRSRRRHHSRSRSRSRSRSHSHDRDREPKRRKIDTVESPTQKRSVSCNDATTEKMDVEMSVDEVDVAKDTKSSTEDQSQDSQNQSSSVDGSEEQSKSIDEHSKIDNREDAIPENAETSTEEKNDFDEIDLTRESSDVKVNETVAKVTPKKVLTPKQIQKKLESERKRKERDLEREKKERVREEKRRQKQELEEQKQKERSEKNEQKAKEREMKKEQIRKEKEEKDQKRKEREEREEQRRKEREQDKIRKQQELEEKNKEKQKQEEKKQKAAAAFANFFVPKKLPGQTASSIEEKKSENFMPFEVKSDMRLAPVSRAKITEEDKESLVALLKKQSIASYLKDLKAGKLIGKSSKTWPCEDVSDDCVLIEEDFGESICEDNKKPMKMRTKFLKFHENRRPAYFGTWRKKSAFVTARKPFGEDKQYFDYDVDSDDDWEEEEQGESVGGSEDEKENEPEDDYEVDNEFFVPHGHLSDDEVDDEANAKLSPESLKQKLKLLKDEFDEDMKTKTHKIKPRSIGCIWYNKDGSNVDESIDRHLKPLAMITNGIILIKKRSEFVINTPMRKSKDLPAEILPHFLKMIHYNEKNWKTIVEDFVVYMQTNELGDLSKASLGRNLKRFASWKKCSEDGPMLNKFCWNVKDEMRQKFDLLK